LIESELEKEKANFSTFFSFQLFLKKPVYYLRIPEFVEAAEKKD
jgi:hypothetical protein